MWVYTSTSDVAVLIYFYSRLHPNLMTTHHRLVPYLSLLCSCTNHTDIQLPDREVKLAKEVIEMRLFDPHPKTEPFTYLFQSAEVAVSIKPLCRIHS